MNHSCIILVPVAGSIDPRCEQALHGLERRGYTVRRVLGFSAIDFGRCVLASEALAEGYEELMWIDSDVGFHPDDVDKLRGHELPFVCGIYAKKSRPEFACDFLPGTRKVDFGQIGGLHEIRYAGFGFVHTRRELYEAMGQRLELPECNQRFGKPVVPYFMPLLVPDPLTPNPSPPRGEGGQMKPDPLTPNPSPPRGEGRTEIPRGEGGRMGTWYLSEDYAFCERARRCGFKIMADTTIRLYHVGSYGYSWEDIAHKREKLANLNVNMEWARARPTGKQPESPLARPEQQPEPATDSREQHIEIDRGGL